MRGFDQGSLGPVDVTGAYIGGNRRFNLNNELYLPVPGAGTDRTLRMFVYADAGNVWGENEKLDARQPARVGRPRRELDLAGGPAEAQLRHADHARSRKIESSGFSSRSGPPSDEQPHPEIAARGGAARGCGRRPRRRRS